jgi:hypothetical protein
MWVHPKIVALVILLMSINFFLGGYSILPTNDLLEIIMNIAFIWMGLFFLVSGLVWFKRPNDYGR